MRPRARWWAVVPVLLLVVGCGQGSAESTSSGNGAGATTPGTGGGAGPGDGVSSPSARGSTAPTVPATGVEGRVVTAAGAPVATATVVRVPVGSAEPLTQEAAVTDLDGRYFWPLTPGTWDIRVEAPGRRSVTKRVVVGDGQRATQDFVLPGR